MSWYLAERYAVGDRFLVKFCRSVEGDGTALEVVCTQRSCTGLTIRAHLYTYETIMEWRRDHFPQ
jgi:hypothetical protein